MASFLTTRGISSQLEEIFIGAESFLYIVTPYLQFSNTLYERLLETTKRGVLTSIICREREKISARDEKLLMDLNCNVYFKKDLHAKCYANENVAMIASMNLYNYSEANNREMGVLLTKREDKVSFDKCIKEIKSIMESAEKHRVTEETTDPIKLAKVEFSYEDFQNKWYEELRKNYPTVAFSKNEKTISASNFPLRGMTFSTEYGFATVSFDNKKLQRQRNSDAHVLLASSLSNYRLYWHSDNRICLYHAKNAEFDTLSADVDYCRSGLAALIKGIGVLLS